MKIFWKNCVGAGARAGAKIGVRVRAPHITIFVRCVCRCGRKSPHTKCLSRFPTPAGPNTTCNPYDKNKTICTQIRLQPIGQSKTSWLLGLTSQLWSIGHSQADTQVINATPILFFLDLGQDGDGNGTLMQCACMTIAFHILPYFFPSQHTTLVYIMHQCISSTFDLSAKIIHIISWSHFSKQFYKYLNLYSCT